MARNITTRRKWGIADWLRAAMVLIVAIAMGTASIMVPSVVLIAILALGGVIFLLVTWQNPFLSLSALLLLLPLHTFMLRLLQFWTPLSEGQILLFSLWKEVALVALLAYVLLRTLLRGGRLPLRFYASDVLLLAFGGLALTYVFVAFDPVAGLYGFRNYVEVFAVFFLVRVLPLSPSRLRRLFWAMLLIGALIALFGILQVVFAQSPFMTELRAGIAEEAGGVLPSAFTAGTVGFWKFRAFGTFSGPNEFGLYLATLLIAAWYIGPHLGRQQRFRTRWVVVALLFISLVLTLSRSAFLALVIGALMAQLLSRAHPLGGLRLRVKHLIAFFSLLPLMGLAFWFSGFFGHLLNTITLRNPSAAGHLRSLLNGLSFIANHALGVGIGMVGERAGRYGLVPAKYHVESSYLQMGMEIGILGMALYVAFMLLILFALYKRSRKGDDLSRRLSAAAFGILAGAMGAYFFLPLLTNLAAASYTWFFVGLAFRAGMQINDTMPGKSVRRLKAPGKPIAKRV
jgi:hypothetical protein